MRLEILHLMAPIWVPTLWSSRPSEKMQASLLKPIRRHLLRLSAALKAKVPMTPLLEHKKWAVLLQVDVFGFSWATNTLSSIDRRTFAKQRMPEGVSRSLPNYQVRPKKEAILIWEIWILGLLLEWPLMAYAMVAPWPAQTTHGPLSFCQVPLHTYA